MVGWLGFNFFWLGLVEFVCGLYIGFEFVFLVKFSILRMGKGILFILEGGVVRVYSKGFEDGVFIYYRYIDTYGNCDVKWWEKV